MKSNIYSVIKATGCYVPGKIIPNEYFLENKFFETNGVPINKPNLEIVDKFEKITGIRERRYIEDEYVTSDMSYFAAKNALESSDVDPETLDYIIVAHNFGDIHNNEGVSSFVPSLAARVKNLLGIINPYCVCFDLIFGCPGWLQGVIQGDFYIKAGQAKRVMVIGAESLSRVSDPHDRDSMIYSDGAGAIIIEARESDEPIGILAHGARSDTIEHSHMLWMDRSYNPEYKDNKLFLKMRGHHLYKYALMTVPGLAKETLDKAGIPITDVKKVFIHQANNKMDEEILKRLFGLYDINDLDQEQIENIMPMTISWLGNSSVATLPTLIDLLEKGKLEPHKTHKDDIVVLTSVGAGMNINCVLYKYF